MDKIRVGWIGYGRRGMHLLNTVLRYMPECEISGVCDLYADRAEAASLAVERAKGVKPFSTLNYRELLALEEVDAVICTASWEDHAEICISSMLAGKPCGVEVGGAYSVDQC